MNQAKEFTVTLSNGRKVTAEMQCDVSTERHYGADADGNGGQAVIWVDDPRLTVSPEESPVLDDSGSLVTGRDLDEALDKLCQACLDYPWSF